MGVKSKVGLGGIEPTAYSNASQAFGEIPGRDAGNRTRATPTPWAHTTTMLHPDQKFLPDMADITTILKYLRVRVREYSTAFFAAQSTYGSGIAQLHTRWKISRRQNIPAITKATNIGTNHVSTQSTSAVSAPPTYPTSAISKKIPDTKSAKLQSTATRLRRNSIRTLYHQERESISARLLRSATHFHASAAQHGDQAHWQRAGACSQH